MLPPTRHTYKRRPFSLAVVTVEFSRVIILVVNLMHSTTLWANISIFIFHRHYKIYCRYLVRKAFNKVIFVYALCSYYKYNIFSEKNQV